MLNNLERSKFGSLDIGQCHVRKMELSWKWDRSVYRRTLEDLI